MYFYVPGKGYSTISTASNKIEVVGLTNTTSYYKAKVRAYKNVNGKKVYGEYSVTKQFKPTTVTSEVNRVTGLTASVVKDEVTLNWNKVSGADGYEIRFYVPGIGYMTIPTTSNRRVISGLTEKQYAYKAKVRAYKNINGKKVYGEYSIEKSFTGK